MSAPIPNLNPPEFTAHFASTAQASGFRAEIFGHIDGHPLIAYTKRSAGPRPRIYLSAGIHGDEPAPPQVLLRLMQESFFDSRCVWFVCPLLGPTGYLRNTRESAAGIDLNRDYKAPRSVEIQAHIRWLQRQPNFDLGFSLHEDWETGGFYLYELNPLHRPSLADPMVEAARAHIPIESTPLIDGRESSAAGIIRPVSDPLLRESWPETIYLRHHHGTLNYTIETPSRLPLAQRITTQCAVLRAALEAFLR